MFICLSESSFYQLNNSSPEMEGHCYEVKALASECYPHHKNNSWKALVPETKR